MRPSCQRWRNPASRAGKRVRRGSLVWPRMASAKTNPARARLFAALDLPVELLRALEAWGARELADPALRAVPAAALHVTLVFLGQRPEEEIPALSRAVTGLRPRRVEFRLRPAPAPRPRRRPRLFALELDSPAAAELQAELTDALGAAGLHQAGGRPYWPHLTVARIRGAARVRRPGPLPDALLRPFDAVRVRLYRSYTRPGGSEYVPLASLDLPPAAPTPGAEER